MPISARGQKAIIFDHLRKLRIDDPNGGWVHTWDVVKVTTPFGYVKIGGDRRIREMASPTTDIFDPYYKVLERRGEGKYEQYRYKFTKEEESYLKEQAAVREIRASQPSLF